MVVGGFWGDLRFVKNTVEIRQAIDELLIAAPGDQRSLFYLLKEYPPSATITSIQSYLERYRSLDGTGIDAIESCIVDKASSLSPVSNAILYWNTSRISNIVDELRKQGETVDDDLLAHISLLPYKHGKRQTISPIAFF